MTDVDNFLAHYGVKGMKWGVRKDRGSSKPSYRMTKATARYLKKGYDPAIAEKKARGRIMTQNVLAITGGTILAAGAGYMAYRAADRRFGGVNLPMGTKVHHVNIHGDKLNLQPKPMFVSFKESDQKFYDSTFAEFIKERSRVDNVFKSTLQTTRDIKAPSNFQASRLYSEFVKTHPDLKNTKYSAFNYAFNEEVGLRLKKETKKDFIDFLASKGYNAMIDNFDSTKSLRNKTRRPTIVFDPTQAMKTVDSILLDKDKMSVGAAGYELQLLTRLLAKSKVTIGGGTSLVGGIVLKDVVQRRQFEQYKAQNPNTKLSDAEIYNLVHD